MCGRIDHFQQLVKLKKKLFITHNTVTGRKTKGVPNSNPHQSDYVQFETGYIFARAREISVIKVGLMRKLGNVIGIRDLTGFSGWREAVPTVFEC